MRCKLIEKFLVLVVIAALFTGVAIPVNACDEEDCDHDYQLSWNRDYKIVEEVEDYQYKVCTNEVHDPMLFTALFPYTYVVTEPCQLPDFATYSRYDTRTEKYPESFQDIMHSYDTTFFEDHYLVVAAVYSDPNAAVTVERLDIALLDNGSDNRLVMIFDCPLETESLWPNWAEYRIIFELPREYFFEEDRIDGDFSRSLEWYDSNPKTGDSKMLLPAMGAMVVAAAGIVITKKRKK